MTMMDRDQIGKAAAKVPGFYKFGILDRGPRADKKTRYTLTIKSYGRPFLVLNGPSLEDCVKQIPQPPPPPKVEGKPRNKK
jgi:hypothetical protein